MRGGRGTYRFNALASGYGSECGLLELVVDSLEALLDLLLRDISPLTTQLIHLGFKRRLKRVEDVDRVSLFIIVNVRPMLGGYECITLTMAMILSLTSER